MGKIVEVMNLHKMYGQKEILKNVQFEIEAGSITGLLGPNGSGKTTIIKILSGLIHDYTGSVIIDGNRPNVYTKSIVSYLPEKTYLSKWMTVNDALHIFADFYQDFDKKKALDMLKSLDLNPEQKTITMSKGMQEKLQLILVMSRKAKFYILDEPIGGVDPAARDYILDTIIKNYNENSAILLSTHLIHDVERIFDHVLFLKNGEIAINESVDELRQQHGKSMDSLFREVY